MLLKTAAVRLPTLLLALACQCAGAHAGASERGAAKAAARPPQTNFETCAREADDLKMRGDAAGIEKKLAVCEALAPLQPQPKIDRAEYLTRLGRYEEAKAEYQKAAALLGGQDPMAAFCHLKTARIFFKLNDIPAAIRFYTKALEINRNDLNAMLGLAAACEAQGDVKAAAGLYARVLKAEPANAKARERLDEINFGLLSGSQLLDELRTRRAADERKTDVSPDDIELLRTLRLAERNGAVDYLRSKTPYIKGLIVERQEQDYVRLMLTMAGFKSYQSYLTRDAVAFFEKKGLLLRDVFALRDLKGRALFEPDGRLTEEGLRAYRQAESGEKTWLLPYETVPSAEEDKLTAEAEKLIKAGFREISEPEYLWLLKTTDCPDEVLRTAPCGIKLIKTRQTAKYFLCWSPPPACTSEAATLTTYVERYRTGDTQMSELTGSTAFFGTGGVAKKRFCHRGKIWYGE